jgi:hypothetical protein
MSCHWPWWRLSTILSRLQTTTQVTIDKTQSAFSIRQPSSSLVGEADVNGTSDDGELLPDLEGNRDKRGSLKSGGGAGASCDDEDALVQSHEIARDGRGTNRIEGMRRHTL